MAFDRFRLSIVVLAAAAASITGAEAAKLGAAAGADITLPFGVQDLVRLQRISQLAVSPDAKSVAFTLRTTDMDANKGRTSIWLIDTRKRGASALRVTEGAANAASADWSGDGRYLYFLSNRSGSNQVWRVPVPPGNDQQSFAAGANAAPAVAAPGAAAQGAAAPVGPAQQITQLPLDVGSFRIAPKGDRVLVTLEVYVDCADLACTRQRLDATAHAAGHGVLYDKLFVRHWDAWSDGRRSQLFGIALDDSGVASGTPVNLTAGLGDVPSKPFGGREDYAVSPDGLNVAFSVRAVPTGEPWSTNFDIYEVAAGGGTPRNLTGDNPAWDGQPAFSPDGSQLAYVATDRPGYESDRFHLVLLNLQSGAKRALTGNWDRSITSFAWSHDGTKLFATTDHLGQHPLWAIDANTGRSFAITGAGEVEGFSVGLRQVFFTGSNLANPADLYAVGFEGGKTQQLTHLNQALLARRRMGEYEQFNFAGWNDENVFGYVVKPVDFKPNQKYPVALLVHGGPQGSLANTWHWRWNAQNFAGAGYAVMMIDFHGSTGYGRGFTDSIGGDWGGKPLEDLKRGVAAALQQYPWLDADNMCALGGSYGGYMINWIAGAWSDRFKCLVTHDGVFDNRSMYYSTEELWFPEWEFGGPEYLNQQGYARHNPVDYVSRWKTPTLVIHGQLDYRVPYEQGLGVYTALQRLGVPSELLYFPDENHWVLKPGNSIQWYDTVLAWMNRWTRRKDQ